MPANPDVVITTRVVGYGDAREQQACVDDVSSALRSRGFNPDSNGAKVDVEIVLERDSPLLPLDAEQRPGLRPPTQTHASSASSVELTAHVTIGRASPTLLRSAGFSCADAAERLASVLQETVDRPSR
jgi:hypothetical protein